MDVKTLCLGVLSRSDASGYEIKKQLEEEPFAHFHGAGFGSIYPALGKLLEDGHVRCTDVEQEKRPDKKVYSLTPQGRLALVRALSQEPAPDTLRSDFLFILFFAHLLSADQVEDLLAARAAEYRARVARMEECAGEPMAAGEAFVHGLGLAYYRLVVDYIDRHGHELVGRVLMEDRRANSS